MYISRNEDNVVSLILYDDSKELKCLLTEPPLSFHIRLSATTPEILANEIDNRDKLTWVLLSSYYLKVSEESYSDYVSTVINDGDKSLCFSIEKDKNDQYSLFVNLFVNDGPDTLKGYFKKEISVKDIQDMLGVLLPVSEVTL